MAIYVPIVMYGLRFTLFTELFTYLYDQVAITSPSFVALHLLVFEIAKCIA